MGRTPKSDEEKELSGAYAKNPQRRRKAGAAAKDCEGTLGAPPSGFQNKFSPTATAHREAWDEIKLVAKAAGVELTEAHRIDVEALARAMVIMRRSEKTSDCTNVSALSKQLGIGKIPTKREVEKAAEKPEDAEWNRLTTPPAPPATRVQ